MVIGLKGKVTKLSRDQRSRPDTKRAKTQPATTTPTFFFWGEGGGGGGAEDVSPPTTANIMCTFGGRVLISGCGDIFVLALFSFFFFFFFRSSAWFLGAPTHGYCSSNSSRRDSVAGPACVLFTRDMTQGVTYCLPPTKESFTSRQTLGRPRIPEPALHSFTWECMLPGGVPCVRRSSPPLQRYRCGKGGAGSKHSVWTYIHSSSEYVCGTGLDTGGGGDYRCLRRCGRATTSHYLVAVILL